MIKAVLDTNVIISAIFWRGNEYSLLAAGREGRIALVVSPEILDEVSSVLSKKFKASAFQTQQAMAMIARFFDVIKVSSKVHASRDPSDDKILACALDARAGFIVTGDNDLLVLKEFRGIRIVRPSDALLLL
jgi:putative PIN family toxin of toxin-antitoxin system